ncbi:MAG TPA: hypothetical protein VHU92_30550 [Streptosporangiaceae bacterium]|nr:hypothetical protein [Streptosporangiaceae bacterium]
MTESAGQRAAAAINCIAVGQSHSQASVKRWNGKTWTAMAVAKP